MSQHFLQIDVSNSKCKESENEMIKISIKNEDVLQVNFANFFIQSKYIRDKYQYSEALLLISTEFEKMRSEFNVSYESIKYFIQLVQQGDLGSQSILQEKCKNKIIVINAMINTENNTDPTNFMICFDYNFIVIQSNHISQLFNFLLIKKSAKIYYSSKYIQNCIQKLADMSKIVLNSPNDENEYDLFEYEINNFFSRSGITILLLDQLNYWKPIFQCIFGLLIQKAKHNSKIDRIKNYQEFFLNKIQEEYFEEKELIELRQLGSGMSAHVSLFYSIRKEKIFAVKILIDSNEEENKKLFERERRNYMNVHYPLFPKYFGTTKIKSYKYCLVIEYLEGKTLKQIDAKKLQKEDQMKIIFEMMLIFEYLHFNEYVYRDLKPDNLFIDENNSVYLIDLGRLRKIKDDDSNDKYTDLFSSYFDQEIASKNPLSEELDISSLKKIITEFFSFEFGIACSEQFKESKSLTISSLFDTFYTKFFHKIKGINEYYSFLSLKNINLHSVLFFPILFLIAEYQNSDVQFELGNFLEFGVWIYLTEYKDIYIIKRKNSLPKDTLITNLIFINPDIDKSIYYYSLSANQNNINAQMTLGYIYLEKKLFDINKSIHYFKLAASQNNREAQCILGKIYYGGKYISIDYSIAIYYFQLAANQNHREAQYFLGMIYKEENKPFFDIKKSIHYFELSADQNFSESMLELGFIYEEGRYVSRNINKAIYYLTLSSKLNNSNALNNLGILYIYGYYVKRDIKKALYYYFESAKLNNEHAQINLARLYEEGKFVEYDINKTIYYYELAANQNNKDAQFNLGVIYSNEQYIPKDINKAIYYFEQAAKQNEPKSLFNLGYFYFEGKHVVRDIKKALYYFKLAADQNLERAQYQLSLMYLYGYYVPKDLNMAVKYFTLSSNQNNSESQLALGFIYQNECALRDINKAIYYYQLSVNLKNREASFSLGKIYEEGKHVPRDINKAIHFYEISAKQYFPKALVALGFLYATGKHVPFDINKAIHYYQAAAYQNNSIAQFNLGHIYYHGIGDKLDKGRGINYLKMSAKNGNIQANFITGFIYHEGKYVDRDIEQAIHYYKEASSFNDQYAKNNLGIIYRYGFGEKVQKNLYLAIEYLKEAVNQKNDYIAMFNLAHIYLFEECNIQNRFDKSIELLVKSSTQGFHISNLLLSVALTLKFGNDMNRIKNEIIKYTDKESNLPSEICQIIYQYNLHLIEYLEFSIKNAKRVYYLYNDLCQPFLGDNFHEHKRVVKSKEIKKIPEISHLFFEGFGLNLI